MALRWLRRIYARIKQWSDEREKDMEQWRESDPDAYYAVMEEQQRNLGRGGF